MILHLITHAHTQQQPAVDVTTWTLSERGQQQAKALLAAPFWSEVVAVVVSAELKTRLTAAPAAAKHHLPIYEDSRLNELRRGGWIEDYGATVAQALHYPQQAVAGWETASATQARAVAAIADLEQRFAGQSVVVVGHGISISLLRAWLLGRTHVEIEAWQRLPFGAWATFDTQARQIVQDFEFADAGRDARRR